jgi:hypothetical protein
VGSREKSEGIGMLSKGMRFAENMPDGNFFALAREARAARGWKIERT